MAQRSKLLDAYVETSAILKAAENWEESYKASPSTFKRLVREEAKLQASLAVYFIGLSERAQMIVNWQEVELKPIQAAAVPDPSDELWRQEMRLLTSAVVAHIIELHTIGAQAGEIVYSRPLGINSLTDFILESAERHTLTMVKDVTSSTRTFVQRAIAQSIREGRDLGGTIELIQQRIANPVRAELIAATESVNAYQTGLSRFAEETGAISKEWDALSGACRLCSPLHGQTLPIGDVFVLANGNEVLRPAAHPRCRCSLIYNYPE